MNMGDLIRKYRLELGLSQQELGQRLEPKVQNSCVARWEKGRVDNIKRSHIKQMAEMKRVYINQISDEVQKDNQNLNTFFEAQFNGKRTQEEGIRSESVQK